MATVASIAPLVLPVAGADMNAEPITNQLTNILAFLNEASNLDEDNCDLLGSNGIVGKSTAQTLSGAKTFSSSSGTTFNYGVTINEGSNDSDTRIETNNMTHAVVVDAGLDAISFGAAAVDDSFVQIAKGASTSTATQNTYHLSVAPGGATTIPSGTTAYVGSVNINEPNITATGTVTNAFTVRIAGAPTEGSSTNYALWVDAGATQLDGTLGVGDTLSVSGDIDMVANGNRIDLDTDNDTSIRASADDTISIEVAGNDDFTITANSLNVLTGSVIDLADNAPVQFGDADDASIKWDTADLAIAAGSADVKITASNVIPATNDGSALGVSGTAWSDLFLASGSVVDFHAGDVTLTHSANTLTVAGGTLATAALTAAGTVTVGEDNTGYDVKFFGATSGKYMLWDEDADSLLVSGDIDMVANGNRIDLDTDNDTSIRASADDTISIEVAGNDDFTITANSLNVLTGSVIDLADNAPVQFGDADDASIKWDTADLAIAAGSADVKITASNVIPATNDGSALGVSGTAWSDLFLASGSVVDFHAGDVTLTHSANTLTVAGGTLATAALTASGTLTANSDVVVNDDSNNRLLLLDNDGTGTALEITQDAVAASTDYALHVHSTVAQTSGELVWIDHDHASSTSDVMRLRNDGTGHTAYLTQNGVLASNKYGLHVYSDAAQTNEALVRLKMDNASSNQAVLELDQDGAGTALQIFQNTHSKPIIQTRSATASGGTTASATIHSGYVEGIGANSTATIWSGRNIQSGFMILCIYDGNNGDNSTALIEFSTHSSQYEGTIMSQSGDDTIAVTTSDVTGTTGTSGQFTVSFRNGIIEFENRLHASVDHTRVGWWIFSH